jgi:hypothetical protein
MEKQVKWQGSKPICDFCHQSPSIYFVDGRTIHQNQWAIMCQDCFSDHGVGLGAGNGQAYAIPSLVKIEG